jgi:hypothetical protein
MLHLLALPLIANRMTPFRDDGASGDLWAALGKLEPKTGLESATRCLQNKRLLFHQRPYGSTFERMGTHLYILMSTIFHGRVLTLPSGCRHNPLMARSATRRTGQGTINLRKTGDGKGL